MLETVKGEVDLIVTSLPYADARHRHYDRYCELALRRLQEEGLARGKELRRKYFAPVKRNGKRAAEEADKQLTLIKDSAGRRRRSRAR
ncbi:MAG: hypothetical protein A2Z34_03125 [Planctomycetes bacterium RBG_16_59_8]|nr:MAG: hypothetical protein A2Z34_03125 [Planctomycetes bacterium RBG_16_59_8]